MEFFSTSGFENKFIAIRLFAKRFHMQIGSKFKNVAGLRSLWAIKYIQLFDQRNGQVLTWNQLVIHQAFDQPGTDSFIVQFRLIFPIKAASSKVFLIKRIFLKHLTCILCWPETNKLRVA